MNSVCLTGRLVKDPEIRYTKNQKPIASFSLAVERDYKDASGENPIDFISCIAWNSAASYLEKYAHKGTKIGVTGRIQSRKWEDQEGKKRYSTEVSCDGVEIETGGKWESSGSNLDPAPKPDPKPRRKRRSSDALGEMDGNYEVYTPPGMDDYGDGGLPY